MISVLRNKGGIEFYDACHNGLVNNKIFMQTEMTKQIRVAYQNCCRLNDITLSRLL